MKPRCAHNGARQALKNPCEIHGHSFDLRDDFARHADRSETVSVPAPEILADLSKYLGNPCSILPASAASNDGAIDVRRPSDQQHRKPRGAAHNAARAEGAATFSDDARQEIDAVPAYAQTRDNAASPIGCC